MFVKTTDLLNYCKENKCSIHEAAIIKEMEDEEKPRDYFIKRLLQVYEVMKSSASKGLENSIKTMSGITGGNAKKLYDYKQTGKALSDTYILEAMARAISTLEINGAMGKIVAAPTAGAAGILPAALTSFQKRFDFPDEKMIEGLLTASAIGGIVAMNATISGAEGGCQAETGTASAMAAAALVELNGGSPEEAIHAASLTIVNILGLVCDPIAGLVEFPCVFRNSLGVTNSITCCDLAMAGIRSIIPFDEVVEAMFNVGNSLPTALRETALGGLAATPTGCTYCPSGNCKVCK